MPSGSAGRGAEIAVAVEHRKAVAVLERAAGPRGRACRRNIEWCFRNWFGQVAVDCDLDLGNGNAFSFVSPAAGSKYPSPLDAGGSRVSGVSAAQNLSCYSH